MTYEAKTMGSAITEKPIDVREAGLPMEQALCLEDTTLLFRRSAQILRAAFP